MYNVPCWWESDTHEKNEDTKGEVINKMALCILPSMFTTRFSVETRERICSSTACWCGASVEFGHSLHASGVCLLGGLVHDLSLHPVASNMPDGQCAPEWPLKALVWPILPCTTSNSSAASVSAEGCRRRSRVASHPMHRVPAAVAPPSALCTLRRSRCRLLEDLLHRPTHCPGSRQPLVLRFRLRILHLRSLKPYCVRNRNQPGLSRQGTNTVG